MATGPLQDPCPVCAAPLARQARYPGRLCQACLDTATDSAGRALAFSNAGPGGGLLWQYRDMPGLADWSASGVRCLVGGRPVLVIEARFGGVVGQPDSRPVPAVFAGGLVDLVQPLPEAAMRGRLRPLTELKI